MSHEKQSPLQMGENTLPCSTRTSNQTNIFHKNILIKKFFRTGPYSVKQILNGFIYAIIVYMKLLLFFTAAGCLARIFDWIFYFHI